MRNIKLLFAISMVFLILLHCATYCEADCHPTSCGSITNISYPFRLRGDPENENCSNSSYELACVNNRAILYLSFGTFFVQSISYNDYSIRLLDPGMEKNSCDSFPKNRVPLNYDYDYRFTPYYYDYRFTPYSLEPYDVAKLNTMIAYIHCEAPAESPFYVDTCICSKNISLQKYSYLVVGNEVRAADLEDSCSIDSIAWISNEFHIGVNNASCSDIQDGLAYGFDLTWYRVYCRECRAKNDLLVYCSEKCSGSCLIKDDNTIGCANAYCYYGGEWPNCTWITSLASFLCFSCITKQRCLFFYISSIYLNVENN